MTSLRRNAQCLAAAACLALAGTGWSAEPLGPGPASWANDLTPIGTAGLELPARRAPPRARRVRRHTRGDPASGRHDARAGGAPSGALPGHRQQRPAALRALGRPRRRARAVPAQPPRHHRSRPRPGRGPRREGQARRQPPHAAGGQPLLLLAAREPPGNQSRRLLVGQPHAQHAAAAGREDGAVLARPLRHQRGEGARLPQDAGAARPVLPARHRQRPRPGDRRGAGPGDARLPRRRREREGRTQRELRPRDHGAVHHGRGQLHRRPTSARPRARSPAGTSSISPSSSTATSTTTA